MIRLNGTDIRDIIYGATLFGGGGGGACASGQGALDQYKRDHHIKNDEDVMVQLMSVDEMDADGYAACTAAMGAPTKFTEVEIAPYINGSFDQLCTIADRMRRDIKYSISVELGGFNTLVPLLVAMEKGIPFIDADGAGRAVPALDTLLLHVNGLPTSPLAMSDNMGNRVSIELKSAVDAKRGEAIGRNVCVAFDQMGGLSGWMVKKNQIAENLPTGSVEKCRKVGKILKTSTTSENIFSRLAKEAGISCRELTRGNVIDAKNQQVDGFDKGYVTVQGNNGTWTTHYLNENLILQKDNRTEITVPDIICYCNMEDGKPLSNADIVGKHGEIITKQIVIGAIQVDEKWWRSGMANLKKTWSHYFNILGYPDQDIVKF